MKSQRVLLRLAAFIIAGNVNAAGSNEVFAITTSSSRQFTAYAPNPLLSSAICAYAEKIKRDWLQRLELPDAWRDPIVFVLRERTPATTNAPAIVSEIFQIEERLKYQITCVVPPPLDGSELAVDIVEALCAEAANHDQPRTRATAYVGAPIPAWLSEGLAQSTVGRPDQMLAVLRRSASGERPLDVMEIMHVMSVPPDQAGRTFYRANAWMLAESLLCLPDGARKMRQLLLELGTTKVCARAFAAVYGNDLPDELALEKWWSLQQARRTEISVAEDLSAAETARRLDALLVINIGPRPAFDQAWHFYQEPWLKLVLQDKLAGLAALRLHAHPRYRPVVAKYIEAIAQLQDVKLNRFRRAVQAAARQRAAVDQESEQIRRVLDRAEAACIPAGTNAFDDFFRTLDRLEKFEQQRHNPISDYLDKFGQ
jgi:hypothetical protein